MATVKVVEIVGRVEAILQDEGVRWTRLELQQWINEAYLSIVALRPDATATAATFTCAAGTRQTLTQFATAQKLLDITRNVAATSAKKAVRATDRKNLDDQRPGWHGETPSVDIQFFTYDPRQPREFLVYPPATVAAQLEVVYSAYPGAHALSASNLAPDSGDATVILLEDIYAPAITDWVLYRAYSKDSEYAANEARAAAAYQAFNAAIGVKTQVDVGSAPKS